MYRPPGAKPASISKGTDKHIVTFEPNGQVIWNSAFHQSEEHEKPLIEDNATTYGMCWDVPGQKKLMMTFATADEMKADNEKFDPADLGKEVFSLPGKTLKKGLTSALNNCTGDDISIIPVEGGRTKFEEGKTLVVDKENKCITLDYTNKRQYSEVSKRRQGVLEKSKIIAKWAELYYSNREEFNKTIIADENWHKEGKTLTGKSGAIKVELSWQEHFWGLIQKLEESDNPDATKASMWSRHIGSANDPEKVMKSVKPPPYVIEEDN